METELLENRVRQNLEILYQQRTERLRLLKLDDVLSRTSHPFWTTEIMGAPAVVQRLIEEYLVSFEKWWNTLIQDVDFCLKAIRVKESITIPKFRYEEQLAHARNRITLEFINKYCTLDYSVDWQKLVQFNSGKD